MTNITEASRTPTTEDLYKAWKATPSPETETRLYEALRGYARAISRGEFNISDPDVVTDIVTKAFLKEASFEGESQFNTWFYHVAMNFCRDYFRRRKARREVQLSDIENLPAGHVDVEAIDPFLSRRLSEAISELTPDQQEFLELRKTMSLGEVANCLKIPKYAAELRWQRLRRRLRRRLEDSTSNNSPRA